MAPDPLGDLYLRRTFRERFWTVVVGGCLAAFTAFIESLLLQWHASGIYEHIIHFLADETFITFGLLPGMAVVWGLFTPKWIENFLGRSCSRAFRIITVISFASVLSVALFLCHH